MPEQHSSRFILITLTALALCASIGFMVIGARGRWEFVLAFRGTKLISLVLVAYAISVSTVLFQTISGNRILTPSIMGFDALYILIQTVLVFTIGAAGVSQADGRLTFLLEVSVMVLFSCLLYRWLFSGAVRSLHVLMLVGIIFGLLFRSLSGMLQRIINPNDFIVLQDRFFASFNTIDSTLLGISIVAIVAASLAAARVFHTFDVLALGRDAAINLGVDYRKTTTLILVVISVLVSVSAALVGPVTFFGLLVSNLAYQLLPTGRHRVVLPAAFLLSVICLVGGQVVLEPVFALDTALSVVIEFAGGLFFIVLLMRGAAR